MTLCKYEITVLRHISGDESADVSPGAALWAAAEGLSEGGYVQKGKLTEKGQAILKESSK